MNERKEQIYSQGQRQLVDNLLIHLRPYMPDMDRDKLSLVSERNAAVASLRKLCEDFGDNDWPDELHLGDVIEKHLARHLCEEEQKRFKAGRYWFHRDTGEHITSTKRDRFTVRPATAEDFDAEDKRIAKIAEENDKANKREEIRKAGRAAWLAQKVAEIVEARSNPAHAQEILREACDQWEYLDSKLANEQAIA